MPPTVIEEPQPGAILLQPADFDSPGHMPPGTVAVGRSRARLPPKDQHPAGQGEGEELGVVELEVRRADCFAEIPGIVPIGEPQADSPLAEHAAGNAIVEGRQIERLLGAERMAGGNDRGRIDCVD